ncbi:MAG: HAD family phosphatase [Asticcacaulis sp.]
MTLIADLLPPAHKKALIFDCDGTLADTFPAHYRAFKSAFAPYGIDFPATFYAARLGLSRSKLLEAFRLHSTTPFDVSAISENNTALFVEHMGAVKAIAPIEALVRHYHGQMKLGVASGGQTAIVTATLKAIDLYPMFDTVVTFEDTGIGKPAPDLYLRACENLKVAPADAHAYEDTDEGLEAAHAAGLSVTDIRPFYSPDPSLW